MAEMPLRALAALLAHRRISAVETVRAALERISALDCRYVAFQTVAREQALREAASLDEAAAVIGPLHGVPVAIKDLADTAGICTTYGSVLYRDHIPAVDDAVVGRLRRAGAVIVGKTITPEFGFGATCVNKLAGPTRNPFDPRLTSGSSSGGSAVAVATGMVPLAHGTDFAGSVRTPASFCGVVSIRPTPGRLANPHRALGWDMLSTAGFLARTVDDLCFVMDIVSGANPLDPLSERLFAPALANRSLRISATEDFGIAPVSQAVRAGFRSSVEVMRNHLGSIPTDCPDCGGAVEAFHQLRPALIHHAYGPLLDRHGRALTETVRWWIERGAQTLAADFLTAEAMRTTLYRRFVAFFKNYDVLVAPAASVLPWPCEMLEVLEIDGEPLPTLVDYLAITYIVSLVGCPVVTLPAAWTSSGVPIGLQLIGPPGHDATLLLAAKQFERDCGFRYRAPPEPAALKEPSEGNDQ
jgi:amidase